MDELLESIGDAKLEASDAIGRDDIPGMIEAASRAVELSIKYQEARGCGCDAGCRHECCHGVGSSVHVMTEEQLAAAEPVGFPCTCDCHDILIDTVFDARRRRAAAAG